MNKLFFILFFYLNLSIFSQNLYVGANSIYNIQTESIGFGFSLQKEIKEFSITANYYCYPKNNFNKVNENIIGLDFSYRFYKYYKIRSYLIAGFMYNAWENYQDSYMLDAKYSTWNPNTGICIKYELCFSPFLEILYNVRWQEFSIKMGVYYNIKCPKKKRINLKQVPNYYN